VVSLSNVWKRVLGLYLVLRRTNENVETYILRGAKLYKKNFHVSRTHIYIQHIYVHVYTLDFISRSPNVALTLKADVHKNTISFKNLSKIKWTRYNTALNSITALSRFSLCIARTPSTLEKRNHALPFSLFLFLTRSRFRQAHERQSMLICCVFYLLLSSEKTYVKHNERRLSNKSLFFSCLLAVDARFSMLLCLIVFSLPFFMWHTGGGVLPAYLWFSVYSFLLVHFRFNWNK
jgi:hypothetical protein